MFSNFHHKKLAMMYEEAARLRSTKKIINTRRNIATLRTISSFVVFVIGLMLILLWVVTRRGFNLSIQPGYNYLPFPFGGVIILLGFMFLIIGLAIVADLALGLSDRLQQEETGSHQDLIRMDNEATREMKTTCKVIARIFGAVISLFMLLWSIYTGFRLATELRKESKYNQLAFSIGVVSIAFGLVYFIIGLAIVKELVQDLSGQLQQKERGNWHSMS